MATLRAQLATLAYSPETDFGTAPESSAGTRIEVINEGLSPATENAPYGLGIDGHARSGSLSKISVPAPFTHYLRRSVGIDLIKAAMRGRVETSGSAPSTHLIETKARDYSFAFERTYVDGSSQLYLGCRVVGLSVSIPTDGNVSETVVLLGTREEKRNTPLLTALESESALPYFATDAFFFLDDAQDVSLIDAAIEITPESSIGRFSPVDQIADEVWVGSVVSKIRATFYASDLDRLGLEASEEVHEISMGVSNEGSSITFNSAAARIVSISRPFIAVGNYAQTIEALCLPLMVTVVNDQAEI